MPLASIPSPGRAVWHLGPLSVRAYALCVIAGIVVAVAVASRRYRRSGGRAMARRGVILDVAAWAIPFGLAGALVHRYGPAPYFPVTGAIVIVAVLGALTQREFRGLGETAELPEASLSSRSTRR